MSIVEVDGPSFYAWLAGAEGRAARQAADERWPSGSRWCRRTNQRGAADSAAELNDDGGGQPHGGPGYSTNRIADPPPPAGSRPPRGSGPRIPDLLKRDFTATQINTSGHGRPLAPGNLGDDRRCCGGWRVVRVPVLAQPLAGAPDGLTGPCFRWTDLG